MVNIPVILYIIMSLDVIEAFVEERSELVDALHLDGYLSLDGVTVDICYCAEQPAGKGLLADCLDAFGLTNPEAGKQEFMKGHFLIFLEILLHFLLTYR